jgi:hypothetical protein
MIEWINAALFRLLHGRTFKRSIKSAIYEFTLQGFAFRLIESGDLPGLKKLTDKQAPGRLDYFNPHKFDLKTLKRTHANPAFIMMGVFEDKEMVGYFFLRCFWNRKCFVGRLIDESYEGKGIGRVMNSIMYNIAWRSGFRCLSTISINNKLVMRSHSSNKTMRILKELDNDYMLVEFLNYQKDEQVTKSQ